MSIAEPFPIPADGLRLLHRAEQPIRGTHKLELGHKLPHDNPDALFGDNSDLCSVTSNIASILCFARGGRGLGESDAQEVNRSSDG